VHAPLTNLLGSARDPPLEEWAVLLGNTQPVNSVSQLPADVHIPQPDKDAGNLRTGYGSGGSGTNIVTNYVAVNAMPNELFEYRVEPIKALEKQSDKEDSVPKEREISRRSEKRRIFEALRLRPELGLSNSQDWATDLDSIWSIRRLFTGDFCDIQDLTYVKQSGREASLPLLTVKFRHRLSLGHGTYDLIGERNDNREPLLVIKALNAIISHAVCQRNATDLHQVGVNRFFLKAGWKDIGTGLLAHRGYFTSIRPGTDRVLLNVNTATSAFFEPILVSDFIKTMREKPYHKNDKDIEKMLRGVTVRITYDRPVTDGINRNAEENRRKVIAGLGLSVSQQKFYTDESDARGTFVWDFYRSSYCPRTCG